MLSQTVVNFYLGLSFLCAVVNLPPCISHVLRGHSGPACFGIWVVILNSFSFVNGILWRDNAIDKAPIFCDISSRITSVGPLGLLISNWCIIRYLATIVTPMKVAGGASESKKRIVLDYSLSFGFPLAVAAGSAVYQTARYEVVKLAGCVAVHALSWPTLMMSLMWPVIFSGVSCAYSFYVIYWLVRQHRNVRQVIKNSNVHLSRFIRMCVLAATYVCISAPYTIFGTIATIYAIGPYVPWTSWSALHDSKNSLSTVRQDPFYDLPLREWHLIVAGLDLFFFFSFANESFALCKRFAKVICPENYFRRKAVLPVQSVGIKNSKFNRFGGLGDGTQTFTEQERNHGNALASCNSTAQTGDSGHFGVENRSPTRVNSPLIHVSITMEKHVHDHDI